LLLQAITDLDRLYAAAKAKKANPAGFAPI
jgi:hypothetical protein